MHKLKILFYQQNLCVLLPPLEDRNAAVDSFYANPVHIYIYIYIFNNLFPDLKLVLYGFISFRVISIQCLNYKKTQTNTAIFIYAFTNPPIGTECDTKSISKQIFSSFESITFFLLDWLPYHG